MAADLPFAIAFDSKGNPKVKNTKNGRKINPKNRATVKSLIGKGKVEEAFPITVLKVRGSCKYVVMIGGTLYEIVLPDSMC
jgi:hypothetical protein